MASPNAVVACMPPSRDSFHSIESDEEIDLSVLFQTPNDNGSNDFLKELESIFNNLKKDRDDIMEYMLETITKMDDRVAKLEAELKLKDEQLVRARENHLQSERTSMDKLNAVRQELLSTENVNLVSTVYFKELMKRLKAACSDGEDFIQSIDCTSISESNNDAKNDSHGDAADDVMVVSDDSDEEVTTNESNVGNEMATAAQQSIAVAEPAVPSNAVENGPQNELIVTDDESIGGEKENVAPVTDDIKPTVPNVDEKPAKAVRKLIKCRWCDDKFPKKSLLSQHKIDIHKMMPKSGPKMERAVKRKHHDEERSDDEESVGSGSQSILLNNILRARGQAIIKTKKAKKIVMSSPA